MKAHAQGRMHFKTFSWYAKGRAMCCPSTPGLRELEPEDPSLAPNFPSTLLGKSLSLMLGEQSPGCLSWR